MTGHTGPNEELAALLAEHDAVTKKAEPRNNADRNLGRVRYENRCTCGAPMPWSNFGEAHRTHVAEQILAALARPAGRADGLRGRVSALAATYTNAADQLDPFGSFSESNLAKRAVYLRCRDDLRALLAAEGGESCDCPGVPAPAERADGDVVSCPRCPWESCDDCPDAPTDPAPETEPCAIDGRPCPFAEPCAPTCNPRYLDGAGPAEAPTTTAPELEVRPDAASPVGPGEDEADLKALHDEVLASITGDIAEMLGIGTSPMDVLAAALRSGWLAALVARGRAAALREARDDIKARITTFRNLNADPQPECRSAVPERAQRCMGARRQPRAGCPRCLG